MTSVKDFVFSTSSRYYGFIDSHNVSTSSNSAIETFLSSPQCIKLIGSLDVDGKISFETEFLKGRSKYLIFYKTDLIDLNGDNGINYVEMATLSTTPTESFYKSLRYVYTPLLLLDSTSDPKLQDTLSQLETILRVVAQDKNGPTSMSVVISINDELDYWNEIANSRKSMNQVDAANAYISVLDQLNEELRTIDNSDSTDMRDIMENVGAILDDLWRHSTYTYPQKRMINLMDILGNTCTSKILELLAAISIWDQNHKVMNTLEDCKNASGVWVNACKTLTHSYWPNHALHPWEGHPRIPKGSQQMYDKLREVVDIRYIHQQLTKLLTADEQNELATADMFHPFRDLIPWMYTSYNKEKWQGAVSNFERLLKPAEEKVAEKLKTRLHNCAVKQVLHELGKYSNLIKRPNVHQHLTKELEQFVSGLISMLKDTEKQIDINYNVDKDSHNRNDISPIVERIQWAKQMESKIKEVDRINEQLLSRFEGSQEIKQLTLSLQTGLRNLYTRLHEDWVSDLQIAVSSSGINLGSEPVLRWSRSGLLRVTLDQRVGSLERQGRQLAALGLMTPPDALAALKKAFQFVQQARSLQQVSNFHNTQGERMIASQRAMMLDAALKLSTLVQEQTTVSWKDVDEIDKYVAKLKEAVSNLVTQNNYLTNQHIAIRNKVLTLMDTDLLSKRGEWKKIVREIRDIIEEVESRGFTNTTAWRIHWDKQLYKALECQYVQTLLTVHEHFPPARVELVYRNQDVYLQPPVEEIRVNHYMQLRRLVSSPMNFVGLAPVADNTESLFCPIVRKYSWLSVGAVSRIEEVLTSASQAARDWSRRASLGRVNLGNLIEMHLSLPQQWEDNFKACKSLGQATAKMSFDDEKYGWLSIGTVSLRRELESQVRNLWSTLLSSLQHSCQKDSASLDAYIAQAKEALNEGSIPTTAKDLLQIRTKQAALADQAPQMTELIDRLRRKQYMLRAWGGDRAQMIDDTTRDWDKLSIIIAKHKQMMEHQTENVKVGLQGEWFNLTSSMESWLTKWQRNRPKANQLSLLDYKSLVNNLDLVNSALEQGGKFEEEKEILLVESEKLGLEIENSSLWDSAQEVLQEDKELWEPLRLFNTELEQYSLQEWIVFQRKTHLFEEFITDSLKKLDPLTSVTLLIKKELELYKSILPILKYLRGNEFTDKHWAEVLTLLEIPGKQSDSILLQDFLQVSEHIKHHVKALQKINSAAMNESVIRNAINELELWYASARFEIIFHKDKKGEMVPIIKNYKEILDKITEQQSLVGSVQSTGGGGDQLTIWEVRLGNASHIISTLAHVQRKWIYLEPILGGNVEGGGGQAFSVFSRASRDFQRTARRTALEPWLSAAVGDDSLGPSLNSLRTSLATCAAALEDYIQEKRLAFPRFYFLSNDDLLEVLGRARGGVEGRESVLQIHLKKLFPGCTGVKLGPDAQSITALASYHGEKLLLENPVDIDSPVEIWLKRLEEEMQKSLKMSVRRCLSSGHSSSQDTFAYPTQIVCLVHNIKFTEQTERMLTSSGLNKFKQDIAAELEVYRSSEAMSGESEAEKVKREAIMLQCRHQMHILEELIENRVTSINSWFWQKQLRFYFFEKEEVVARMGLARMPYTYEYLGLNTGQFVRTEITDQCFLILTQALHLGLIGNPFGPAGTGKTESIKALGGLLGRLVLVFNCDEAMDTWSMGRLLTGLALAGAWGCFDEFNRLTEETLSGISQQLTSFLRAAKSHGGADNLAVLNGKEVSLRVGAGALATLNPSGAGYGGRRQLRGAFLRPAASPNLSASATRNLACALLPHALPTAAQRIPDALTLASELLSPSHHYDWGLRALKTIIGSCALALRQSFLAKKTQMNESEQLEIIVRAIRLNTMSKLTYQDAERFNVILHLIFPGIPNNIVIPNKLDSALTESYNFFNLQYNDKQVKKCMEFYEQLQQRMGIIVVGPPGSGKSVLRKLLKYALIKMGRSIYEHIICPKAISRQKLLGYIDPDTRQWNDGVISSTALTVCNEQSDIWSWVVCDGDVDPEWIESLNSVLDDNRLLTLPSGWRIQFGSNVNFIFETHDLKHASPATISRMGIILLSEEEYCIKGTLDTWIDQRSETESNPKMNFASLLHNNIPRLLEWSAKNRSSFALPIHPISIVRQVTSQLDDWILDKKKDTIPHDEAVACAITNGVGGILKTGDLTEFEEQVSEWTGVSSHAFNAQPNLSNEIELVEDDNLLLSPRVQGVIEKVTPWLNIGRNFMLIGSHSSGKNIIIDHISKYSSGATVISLKCTPIMQPHHIIEALKQNMAVLSSSSRYVASKLSKGGKVILIVKSLHRSFVDEWGSSPVQSFLLQILEYGGFWDTNLANADVGAVQWVQLKPIQLILTAVVEEREQCGICPRLSNAVRLITVRYPESRELSEICQWALEKVLRNKSELQIDNLSKIVKDISEQMMALFQKAISTFTSEIHYRWSAGDLTKWCDGINNYKTDSIDILTQAIQEEATTIFRNRLVTLDEKNDFDLMAAKSLNSKSTKNQCFAVFLGDDGIYFEQIETDDWKNILIKTINQCYGENDGSSMGNSGTEYSTELSNLCSIMARAFAGEVVAVVSPAGIGRRAAIQVLATLLGAKITFLKTYHQLEANIKNLIISSGIDGQRNIVILEEGMTSVQSELASALGTVEMAVGNHTGLQSLLSQSELQAAIAQNRNNSIDLRTMTQNIQRNLGIIILLNHYQNNLGNIMENYPMIFQRCYFLWLNKWSDLTVNLMPKMTIDRLCSELSGKNAIVQTDYFVKVYSILDDPTPYRYVAFIKAYFYIYQDKKVDLVQRRTQLQAGVAALTDAKNEVATLKAEAARQEAILSEKQAKANQALNQISSTVQSAVTQREEMQELKKNMEIENSKLQQRKSAIEEELSAVEPLVEGAKLAVGDIKAEALAEVRSLRAPPDAVRHVLRAVLRLMGVRDDTWHSMKMFLSRRQVKDDIRSFDAANIQAEDLVAVQDLVSKNKASFTESVAKRASIACAPLAAWVVANMQYATVLQRTAPLQAEQRALRRNLEQAEAQIESLGQGLASVDDRVAALKIQLNQYTREAAQIELNLDKAKETIAKAESLVEKLSTEYHRWVENVQELTTEYSELTGRSLLAAAFIVYLSGKSEDERSTMMKTLMEALGITNTFSIKNFLVDRKQQLQWTQDRLPNDDISFENASIINQVLKDSKIGVVPLIIDPDGKILKWLQNHLKDAPHDTVMQFSERFNTSLNHALRFGKTLIIEDLSSIDETWSSLLRGQNAMNIGTAVNPAFRLILCTRDVTLLHRLPPHNSSLLVILDFSPQMQGLIDYFIHCALKQEQPKLQEDLEKLQKESDLIQKQQYEMESALLDLLSKEGSPLRSTALDSLLGDSEKCANRSVDLARGGSAARQSAKEAANRVSIAAEGAARLSLSLAKAARANPALAAAAPVLSPQAAARIFCTVLRRHNDGTGSGLDFLKDFVKSSMERILTALNKEYHSTVALYLLKEVYPGELPSEYWNIFIGNGSQIESSESIPHWIEKSYIKKVAYLKNNLPNLYERLNLDNEQLWSSFRANGSLESIPPSLKLKLFEKALVVQALQSDKLFSAINYVIAHLLGVPKLSSLIPPDALSAVEKWSSEDPNLGVILVLGGRGEDAAHHVIAFAQRAVGLNHFHQLNWTGTKSEEEQLKSIYKQAALNGDWLSISSPPAGIQRLVRVIKTSMQSIELNPSFRWWVTSEEGARPPAGISCSSVALEAPEGVRGNLLRTLARWHSAGEIAARDNRFVRLLFCVALAHSHVQERRAYIPQGWSRWYGFDWADIEACRSAIADLGGNGSSDALATAAGYCRTLLGGRVSHVPDTLLLNSLVDGVIRPEALSHAWKPRGIVTTLPDSTNLQDYINAVMQFPMTDSPLQLGLPENVRIAWEKRTAEEILAKLRQLEHPEEDSVLHDKRRWRKLLSPPLKLWKKLNAGPDSLVKLQETDWNADTDGGWWAWTWSVEVKKAAQTVRLVHDQAAALFRASSGGAGSSITPQLTNVAVALIADKTPSEWQQQWSGPKRASLYMRELVYRASQAVTRLKSLDKPAGIFEINLRSFMSVERILPALRAESAQCLNNKPVDLQQCSIWGRTPTNNELPHPNIPVAKLTGLQLEGAIWVSNAPHIEGILQPCSPNSPPYCAPPPIYVYYKKKENIDLGTTINIIDVPVYSSQDREELVFYISANTSKQCTKDTWILNAAALFVGEY